MFDPTKKYFVKIENQRKKMFTFFLCKEVEGPQKIQKTFEKFQNGSKPRAFFNWIPLVIGYH